MLDTATVFATGIGAVVVFALFRGYSMWKHWSNTSKVNDEIALDKKIADAIKMGDVETIARLRKYFLAYKKRHPEAVEDCNAIERRLNSN